MICEETRVMIGNASGNVSNYSYSLDRPVNASGEPTPGPPAIEKHHLVLFPCLPWVDPFLTPAPRCAACSSLRLAPRCLRGAPRPPCARQTPARPPPTSSRSRPTRPPPPP